MAYRCKRGLSLLAIEAATKWIDCAGGRVSSRAANTAAGDSRPPNFGDSDGELRTKGIIPTFSARSSENALPSSEAMNGWQ